MRLKCSPWLEMERKRSIGDHKGGMPRRKGKAREDIGWIPRNRWWSISDDDPAPPT